MTAQNPGITSAPSRMRSRLKITRQMVIALAFIVLALAMIYQSNRTLAPDITTVLTFVPGSGDGPRIAVPTLAFMNISGAFFLLSGLLGLWNPAPQRRLVLGMMTISGILIVPALIIGAAAGSTTNMLTMLVESFQLATPIAIGAMAGLWCERSGVVNIAIEGMMLFSACFGFVTLFFLQSRAAPDQIYLVLFISVVVAVLTGGVVALLHAWLSITFSTDQIVSGTVINILAVGATSFIRREYLLSTDQGFTTLPNIKLPILGDLPVIGPAFFTNKPIFFMMFVVIIVTHIVLFYTRWGLRVRAVGEYPGAADTLGIKVNRTRWISVFIGGLIAGLAGAWFSLEATGRFNDNMTNGAGFIALAAMIFGKWMPFGALAGAVLFGFANALGTRFQIIGVPMPVQFLQMVPYVVTLIVLAGVVGRAFPPKAVGTPYKKE